MLCERRKKGISELYKKKSDWKKEQDSYESYNCKKTKFFFFKYLCSSLFSLFLTSFCFFFQMIIFFFSFFFSFFHTPFDFWNIHIYIDWLIDLLVLMFVFFFFGFY